MRRIALLILMLALMLTGCSRHPEDVQTRIFEIALDGTNVLAMDIPANWSLTEQDGFHYWKFNDNIEMYKTKTPIVSGNLKGDCYYTSTSVSRNFDDYSIMIDTDKKTVDTVGKLLSQASIGSREVIQYRERGLESLPDYKDYPMDFTTNNLYMPLEYNEVQSDVFTSCNSINGTSFITCWMMNYKLEDLKPILMNLVTCNSSSGKLDSWYESSDIFYAESEGLVVAAKKITYNKWCCYLSSNDSYADYLLKAMYRIKASD